MSEERLPNNPFVKPSLGTNSRNLQSQTQAARILPRSRVFENLPTPIDALTHAYYLVTKRQLAQQLALSPSYISKLMAEEGLPHIKIGRAVRFRPKEVVEWLTERKMP